MISLDKEIWFLGISCIRKLSVEADHDWGDFPDETILQKSVCYISMMPNINCNEHHHGSSFKLDNAQSNHMSPETNICMLCT